MVEFLHNFSFVVAFLFLSVRHDTLVVAFEDVLYPIDVGFDQVDFSEVVLVDFFNDLEFFERIIVNFVQLIATVLLLDHLQCKHS